MGKLKTAEVFLGFKISILFCGDLILKFLVSHLCKPEIRKQSKTAKDLGSWKQGIQNGEKAYGFYRRPSRKGREGNQPTLEHEREEQELKLYHLATSKTEEETAANSNHPSHEDRCQMNTEKS